MPPRKDTLKWKEYQANAPKKARKTKIKLSNQDRQILEGYFQQNNFPSTEQINQLLEQLNSYTANEIRVWFRNRRAKLRREQEQEQSTTQRMKPTEKTIDSTEYVPFDELLSPKFDFQDLREEEAEENQQERAEIDKRQIETQQPTTQVQPSTSSSNSSYSSFSDSEDIQMFDFQAIDSFGSEDFTSLSTFLQQQPQPDQFDDIYDSNGYTILSNAILENNFRVVNLLVEQGENVNLANRDGSLPLDLAILKQNHQIIDLLIQKGARNK